MKQTQGQARSKIGSYGRKWRMKPWKGIHGLFSQDVTIKISFYDNKGSKNQLKNKKKDRSQVIIIKVKGPGVIAISNGPILWSVDFGNVQQKQAEVMSSKNWRLQFELPCQSFRNVYIEMGAHWSTSFLFRILIHLNLIRKTYSPVLTY